MKYYAVGTPIGRLNENNEQYFSREGRLLSMSSMAFSIWVLFLHGADDSFVINKVVASNKYSTEQAKEITEALVSSELLISEKDILDHYPQRLGYGIGYSSKKNTCSVFLHETIEVTYPAYLIWAYCDGKSTCNEILNHLPESISKSFKPYHLYRIIDELLRNNLLLFTD